MFVKCTVGLFWGTRFQQWRYKRQFTVFHGIGSDFQIHRKKSKLFFTDALNIHVTSAFVYTVHCTELSDISIEGFISKFLHVNNTIFRVSGNSSLQRLYSFHLALNRSSPSFCFLNSWPLQLKEHYFHKKAYIQT